jgi:hypothetical protein
MQIKREMLIALAKKDEVLWPNDPEKRNVIYNRYKAFEIPVRPFVLSQELIRRTWGLSV